MPRFIFIIISVLAFSCKEDCPDSYVIENAPIPRVVENRIKYRNVDTLRFVNEFQEEVIFSKYYEEIDNVVKEKHQTVDCEADPNQSVDIYFKKTWNKMFYSTKDLDTLKFIYRPIYHGLLKFSWKTYDYQFLLDGNGREPPHYLLTTKLVFQEDIIIDFLRGGRPMRDDYELFGEYKVKDISYPETYFSTENDTTFLFFTLEDGLVGFRDAHLVNWIRK
ncbi:MAG: hypothetical protein AAGA77_12810 [Bacteroidota bacterium]